MRAFLLPVICSILFYFSSCKKYKQADAAFFLKAGPITVAPTAKQGSASHKITDLWLYVDGKFQGCYPVGHLMPIVTNNHKVKIDILAGIKNNGISDTRIFWSMYERLEFDTLIEAGTTIERPLTFNYKTSTVFPLIEGFEGGANGFSFQPAKSDTVFYTAAPEECFEGKSIQMGLTGRCLVGKIESSTNYSLPHASSDVYLEFNYKSNVEFVVGVIGDDQKDRAALIVAPKNEWNKIYVQLANVVNADPLFAKYKIFFQFLHKDEPVARLFLDNVKVVYLP